MFKIHYFIKHTILSSIDFFYAPFKKLMPLQTFRYAACGGSNTLFDILLFSLSYNFLFKKEGLPIAHYTVSPHIAALIFSFSISFCTGFYLNRYIVFKASGLSKKSQLYRYMAVNAICILLNVVLLKTLVDYVGLYPTVSKIIATGFIIFFSYFSQTYFFFKPQIAAQELSRARNAG
ncbi:GtrA family protein [Mucilaginibacter sp. CSA2-8R]|uniref:GtrA family protein n=1 Tax=Mucilaginibacter sp. CSA2-8R TaxID=3141542 RepID=UPI00315D1E7B